LQAVLKTGLEKKQFSQQICCNYLQILLLSQGQNVKDLQKDYSRSVTSYLECKKYIDDNFSRIPSPQQVAEYCNLNPRYMSSLFKRYSDNSPHEYLTRLKLNKAANMLLTSRLTIKEIAREVGFDDPYHFSRNFKKFHKLSPKYYRNIHI
jgi:AraC-like DNA-binding protein